MIQLSIFWMLMCLSSFPTSFLFPVSSILFPFFSDKLVCCIHVRTLSLLSNPERTADKVSERAFCWIDCECAQNECPSDSWKVGFWDPVYGRSSVGSSKFEELIWECRDSRFSVSLLGKHWDHFGKNFLHVYIAINPQVRNFNHVFLKNDRPSIRKYEKPNSEQH